MKFLLAIAIAICLGAGEHDGPSDGSTKGKRKELESGSKGEEAGTTPDVLPYKLNQFVRCGDFEGAEYNGVKLVMAFIREVGARFSPTEPGGKGATCSFLAIKGERVLGRVTPRHEETREKMQAKDRYTVVPGSMLGKKGSKRKGRYMLIPSLKLKTSHRWIPAPCTLQERDSMYRLALTNGPDGRSDTRLRALDKVDEKQRLAADEEWME